MRLMRRLMAVVGGIALASHAWAGPPLKLVGWGGHILHFSSRHQISRRSRNCRRDPHSSQDWMCRRGSVVGEYSKAAFRSLYQMRLVGCMSVARNGAKGGLQ